MYTFTKAPCEKYYKPKSIVQTSGSLQASLWIKNVRVYCTLKMPDLISMYNETYMSAHFFYRIWYVITCLYILEYDIPAITEFEL